MAWANTTSFVALVNGETIGFFRISRGLRKGCPLSPLLFLLIVEGILDGILITRVLAITHILFVDDVLLFDKGTMYEWRVLEDILDTFSFAIGMAYSGPKCMFLESGMDEVTLFEIRNLFPFEVVHIDNDFKYLGYFLKPNNYLKEDWWQLLKKVEKRISHWSS